MIKGTDGKFYIYSSICSPEVWLEEKTSSSLDAYGTKDITFDARFTASTKIDGSNPVHVSITPTSDPGSTPLWAETTSSSKITVHGASGVTFDVIIAAKVLNQEGVIYEELLYDEDTGRAYSSEDSDFSYNQSTLVDLGILEAQMKMAAEIPDNDLYLEFKDKFDLKKADLVFTDNPNIPSKTFYCYVGAVPIIHTLSAETFKSEPAVTEFQYDGSNSLEIIPSAVYELIQEVFIYGAVEDIEITPSAITTAELGS